MISIQELLYNRGLDKKAKVKLVRHKDSNFNIYETYRTDKQKFLIYQCRQGADIFGNTDYIVSFIGEAKSLARFIGVFKVGAKQSFDGKRKNIDGGFYAFEYELEEVNGFERLSERVIIDWGKATLSWHQWITNEKEVVEIQRGLNYQPFTDYLDFILDFHELKEMVSKGYKDWKSMLSSTKGIYLIRDTRTGKLYVGSAYGVNGFWGRWSTYVNTNGHGGNKYLKVLIKEDPHYGYNFRFSILMVLSKTTTNKQVIQKEQLFKKKLGSNAFGLNAN